MRGRGDQPSHQRFRSRPRSARKGAAPSGGAPTGVFSAIGAEPRSSWTEPGDTVIPNPSVDPSTRSWVDPDAVPGVLGPPQANPTTHDEPPIAAPANFAEALRSSQPRIELEPRVELGASGTGLLHRLGIDGQTGPIELARDPRTRLVGALVAVVVAVLLLGRLGDLVSPAAPSRPGMGLGAPAAPAVPAPTVSPPAVPAPTPPADKRAPAPVDDRAPQLIVIGVEGGLSGERVQRWKDASNATAAKVTFFASITDLLGPVGIDRYLPPGPGEPAAPAPVATSDDEARRKVGALVEALSDTAGAGHEVAAVLGPDDCPGGGDWTTGDWASELGQLRSVGARPNDYNAWGQRLPDVFAAGLRGAAAACAPAVGGTDAAGGPSPLAGALAEADLGWMLAGQPTTSRADVPRQRFGLWRFSPTVDTSLVDPGALEAQLADGLAEAMASDRAPFVVTVRGGGVRVAAADEAVRSFAKDACRRSDVRCVTFSEAARQLDSGGPVVPG